MIRTCAMACIAVTWPRKRSLRPSMFSVVGILLLALAACESRATRDANLSPTPVGRERWALRFDADSAPVDFTDLLVVGDRVVLLNADGAELRAYALESGALLWTRGRRGAGPGEFQSPTSLFAVGDSTFGVVDPRQGRISIFSANGTLLREISGARAQGDLNSVCHDRSGSLLAIRHPHFEIVDLQRDSTPVVVDSVRWPVAIYNEAPELQQGRFARTRTGRCVIYQHKGDFYRVFDPADPRGGVYREYATDFPTPTIDRSGRVPRVLGAVGVVQDAALSGDTLYLLRTVRPADTVSTIDRYLASTGTRLGAVSAPRDAYKIDVADELLVILRSNDTGSAISAYSRTPRSR